MRYFLFINCFILSFFARGQSSIYGQIDSSLHPFAKDTSLKPDSKRLFMRCQATIMATEPIVVVDGVVVKSISEINSDSVSSIEVIKDAEAFALFGSSGAAGAILVETKKHWRQKHKVLPEVVVTNSYPTRRVSCTILCCCGACKKKYPSFTENKPVNELPEPVVFPNPVPRGMQIHIMITRSPLGLYEYQLIDVSGKKIKEGNINVNSDKQRFIIDSGSPLSAGVYFLTIKNNTAKKISSTCKVIIQ